MAPGPAVDEYIVKFRSSADLILVATELAKYSVKDFAVRYDHLEPNAKA